MTAQLLAGELPLVPNYYGLARDLVREGNEVTMFLVQNGVLPARPCARSEDLERAVRSGVRVLADEFSLRERGMPADGLVGKRRESLRGVRGSR